MALDPDALGQGWLGKTIALAVGAIATAAAGWFAGRKTEKANIVAIATNAAMSATLGVIASLRLECERIGAELGVARHEVQQVREQHRECESRLDALEQEKRDLRAKIDELMSGGVANYSARDIQRGGGRRGK